MVLEDLIGYTITTFGVLAIAWVISDQFSQILSYIIWRFSKTGEER